MLLVLRCQLRIEITQRTLVVADGQLRLREGARRVHQLGSHRPLPDRHWSVPVLAETDRPLTVAAELRHPRCGSARSPRPASAAPTICATGLSASTTSLVPAARRVRRSATGRRSALSPSPSRPASGPPDDPVVWV